MPVVSWFDCGCEWTTKYCEENHVRSVMVDINVLEGTSVETVTTPTWQAMADEALDLERRIWALRQQSAQTRCPFSLHAHDSHRCMFDAGHEGDHRLPEWSWSAPPAE
jgi:hypothetical protein